LKILEGLSTHDHEHGEAHEAAPARHKHLALRQAFETPRRAGAATKARGTRGDFVATYPVHGARRETMRPDPSDHVDVHADVEINRRSKNPLEQ
jgi:hypothetical protein